MTIHSSNATPTAGYRLAGQLAIISGVIGLAAFASLMMSLMIRASATDQDTYNLLIRGHDVAIILQSFCLMPLVLVVANRIMAILAIALLSLVSICTFLGMLKVIADVLYMIPQGAFGGWLIALCLLFANHDLRRGLLRLGVLAGIGLILVSVFPIGYYLFVDPAIFHGPLSDDVLPPAGTESANGIVHLVLAVGTFTGCTTYPIWSVLVGRRLLSLGQR